MSAVSDLSTNQATAQTTITVDGAGGADFLTVTAAVAAAKLEANQPVLITVAAGTYNEDFVVDVDDLEIRGADKTTTIIQAAVINEASLKDRGVVRPQDADRITLRALEIKNTLVNPAGGGSEMAVSMNNTDQLWIDDCRLIGDQDTITGYTAGATLFITNSYIEGLNDIIAAGGPTMIDGSTIYHERPGGSGWCIANRQIVCCNNCTFDGSSGGGTKLARFLELGDQDFQQLYLFNCTFSDDYAISNGSAFLELVAHDECEVSVFYGNVTGAATIDWPAWAKDVGNGVGEVAAGYIACARPGEAQEILEGTR